MADSDFSGFSFPQSPGSYHNGLSRTNGDEGSQYLQIPGSHVDGYSHLFQPASGTQILQSGSNVSALFDHSVSAQWQSEGDVMSRWISQTSTGSIEMPQISGVSSDSNYSEIFDPLALHRGLSQVSFASSANQSQSPGSSSSLSDSAAYIRSPQYMDSQVYSELNPPDSGDAVSQHASFCGSSEQIIRGPDGSSFLFAGATEEILFNSALDLGTQMDMPSSLLMSSGLSFQEHLTLRHDSFSLDGASSDSRTSSPTVYGSPGDNNFDALINVTDVYPSNHSSLLAQQSNDNPDEFTATVPTMFDEIGQGRRRSPENDNSARDHPLYQKSVGADGLYHCPWEKSDHCTHKPEKLKCNYDKFVDSHLKPFRCKVSACEKSKFSSTACVLRHEREAHGLHGHGEKPFLCTAEGCERGLPGQGFPRHWNLCDHMKRVHNIIPGPSDADHPVQRSRKRKAGLVEPHLPTKRKAIASQVGVKTEPIMIKTSLEQQFDEERRQLIASVQHLDDPSDPEALQKLRLAKDILKNMASASPGISAQLRTPTSTNEQSG